MKNKKLLTAAAALVFIAALAAAAVNITPLLAMLKDFTAWLVGAVESMGYAGITALMFLESSFFPFPSEVVMPPAGYLAYMGRMSLLGAVAAGIVGSILGALFNYWIAVKLGRPFLLRYGKYFFITQESVEKSEAFFTKHGHISTLVGRLLPVIRQYISLPAGIARMPLGVFTAFTALGAGVWVVLLTLAGYMLGSHQELLTRYLHVISLGCVAAAAALGVGYALWVRRSKGRKDA